ncbi:MAG: type II toxin-antitoxin system RelE/ParE family toxin [Armatimonadetes bacterium]|nr:type II toxin-antitoxin system RelE/ParE family toxin [Armatimonadota bacterium]
MLGQPAPKPLAFIGTTEEDLRALPREVRRKIGYVLYRAQVGGKSMNAKPLAGFHGAGVVEVVEDFSTDTYRAVYTVRFAGVVYALHVFQKKSRRGIATPRQDMKLIEQRLQDAEEHYREHWGRSNGESDDE